MRSQNPSTSQSSISIYPKSPSDKIRPALPLTSRRPSLYRPQKRPILRQHRANCKPPDGRQTHYLQLTNKLDSPLYIPQADWQRMWQKATRLDLAIVDIRRKGTVRDGQLILMESDDLAEVAKYVVKPQGYFMRASHGWELPTHILGAMHHALKGLASL